MLGFLSFFSFIFQLFVTPAPRVTSVPVQEIIVQDTVQLLANEWVLQKHLQKEGDAYTPVLPLDSLTLELFDDKTYRFKRIRYKSVEWGKWQLDAGSGMIGVQVENMDGYATLNAMLDRWQILKLTPQQLVLKPFGMGNEYLVFARAN